MASPWILLQRKVSFVQGEVEPVRSTRRASKPAAEVADWRRKETLEEAADAMAANLEAMRPVPQLFDPPVVNQLSMVQQMDARHKVPQMDGIHGGRVSCTDKALVLLYVGGYQPGFSNNPLSGCYLVYDASNNSLSAIPQLPDPDSFFGLGRGAAILSSDEGTYMVAELVEASSGFPKAVLFLWQSCRRKWIRRHVHLPKVFSPDYFFRIDMAFTHADSQVCWVDLLKGVLICNLKEPTEPEFTFVELPMGFSIDIPHGRRPRTEEFRTMGSVGGAIKFATLHGYYEELSCEEVLLKTWTLSHDLKCWVAGKDVCVSDLCDSFAIKNLPKATPSCPVLCVDKPEVVYVVLDEIDSVDVVDVLGYVSGEDNICKAQYVIGLDTKKKQVISCAKSVPDRMTPQFSNLIATEFTAHLQRPMEGGFEASGAGGSLKLMKHARGPGRGSKRNMH